jgi:sulfofructose kinase
MIVGFGENSVDIVYRLPRYPQPGTSQSKMAIERRDVRAGGQVATALATCAAFGLPTRYIGSFGSDANARLVRDELQRRGVDVSLVLRREAPNRYAVVLIDASSGDRIVLWDRDARLAIAAEEVLPEWIAGATLVHVDTTDMPAAVALARMARGAGLEVTTDIDDVTGETGRLLDTVTIPILAEHVPAALTGESDPERALRLMRRTYAGRLVVTLGSRGAAMLDGDRYVQVPGFAVDVVDSTGAGDVFRGAFIYSLLKGDTPERMLQFANAAAAIACMREGAMNGVPTLSQVSTFSASPNRGAAPRDPANS